MRGYRGETGEKTPLRESRGVSSKPELESFRPPGDGQTDFVGAVEDARLVRILVEEDGSRARPRQLSLEDRYRDPHPPAQLSTLPLEVSEEIVNGRGEHEACRLEDREHRAVDATHRITLVLLKGGQDPLHDPVAFPLPESLEYDRERGQEEVRRANTALPAKPFDVCGLFCRQCLELLEAAAGRLLWSPERERRDVLQAPPPESESLGQIHGREGRGGGFQAAHRSRARIA